MKKFFKLEENKTNVRTEILAGITTFLAMAYILAVNPGKDALGAIPGVSPAAIFMATAISAAIATICMAFFANYPVALASGMGLNAFFAFTVCLGMGYSYQVALTAVFVEGIIFMIMSLFKFREALVNKIPKNLKFGITAGIGLFITIIALLNAKIIVAHPATTVSLGNIGSAQVALALIGLLVIGLLQYKKVPGGILLGIIITWVLGMVAEAVGWYQVDPANGVYSVFPDFSAIGDSFAAPALFEFDFGFIKENFASFAIVVFTFLYTDIFDTVGTLIGVGQKAGLTKQDGSLPRAGGALMADAVGTVVGACLGTSTVTSFVESSAGVAAGGRTGLTALTTGIMFLIAIPFAPIFLAIPGFATTPAMLYVGILMLSAIKNMDFDGDIADVVGGFLAVIMMPFAYSIATGIMFGILSWVILKVLCGKFKDVSGIMWVSFALFVFYIIMKVTGKIA